MDEPEEALQILQTGIEHTPAAVLAYQTLAQYYYNQEDDASAAQSYQNGLDVVPGAAELMVDRGNMYVEEYKTAQTELSGAESYVSSAQERYEISLLMPPNRDWAVEARKDALANYLSAQRHLSLAQSEVESSQPLPADALTEFRKALVVQPSNTSAMIGLGKIAEINAEWDKAVEYYQQGLSINPHSADLWNALGQVYLDRGLIEEARRAFWNAITIEPSNIEASAGIIAATQTLSSWSIPEALDNVAYSQYRWEALIEFIRTEDK
jgi:Tfp pilus assembly protein PilF